jgi:hypothetical protein
MLKRIMLVTALLGATTVIAETGRADDTYGIHFSATFRPELGFVDASMTVSQTAGELEWLDMNAAEGRTFEFAGDGQVRRDAGRVRWDVPRAGGQLRWRVRVDRLRGDHYDARMTRDWALLRIDHLFPPAHVSTRGRERSQSTLDLKGPRGWSFETRYGRVDDLVPLPPGPRRFTRPTGWMMAGKMGVRRDTIAGRRVVIAGPRGERLRSQDILALLHWTLPELVALLPHFPERLLIVNAGDPLWRGGLSGPDSLYLHSARPLISADGTSTPVHELVHVGTSSEAEPGNDWIVEGLAEFYSIELLRRSGTISRGRARRTFASIEARAQRGKGELRSPSSGVHTARAVTVFHDLDRELRKAMVAKGLDAVATPLLDGPPLSRAALEARVTELLGRPSDVLENAFERYLQTP